MKIRFNPGRDGSHQDKLTLGYFLGNGWTWEETNLDISGTATITPKGELTLTGAADFGELQLGEEVVHILNLENKSGESVRLDGNWFNNTDGFAVNGGTCSFQGSELPNGSSCSIEVTFKPTWEGSYNEVFTVGYYPGQTWDYKSLNLDLVASALKAPAPPTDKVSLG